MKKHLLEGCQQGGQHKSSTKTSGRSSEAEIRAWQGLSEPGEQNIVFFKFQSRYVFRPWFAATTGVGASLRVSTLHGTRQFAPDDINAAYRDNLKNGPPEPPPGILQESG